MGYNTPKQTVSQFQLKGRYARQYLSFAGKSSKDFLLYLSGPGVYDSPAADVESTSVPGRNGDIITENARTGRRRYQNVDIKYKAFFFNGLPAKTAAVKAWLLSPIVISGATYAVILMQKAIPNSDFESSAFFGQLMSVAIGVPFLFTESSFTSTDIWAVAVLGIVQMGLSYVFLSIGLRSVSPITASLTSTVEPILNPVLVAIFYHETVGWLSLFGGAVVIGSVAVYNVLKAKEGVKNG